MSDAFQHGWVIAKDFSFDPPSLSDVLQMRGTMGRFVPPGVNAENEITDVKTRWQYDKDGNPERIAEKVEPYLPRGYQPGFAGVNLGSQMWHLLYGIYRGGLEYSPSLAQGIVDTLTHESTHSAMDPIIREILNEEYQNRVDSGELTNEEANKLANEDYGQFHEYGAYAAEYGTPAHISREKREPVKRMETYSRHPAVRQTPKQAHNSAELLDVARTLMPKLPNFGLSTRKDRNDRYEVIPADDEFERADELWERYRDMDWGGTVWDAASEPDDMAMIDTMMSRKPYEHYSEVDFDIPEEFQSEYNSPAERDFLRRYNYQKTFEEAMGLRALENAQKERKQ